jgi:hypothetical protein
MNETTARANVHNPATNKGWRSDRQMSHKPIPTTVVMMAIPPPRTVGRVWLDRWLGESMIWQRSKSLLTAMPCSQHTAAATRTMTRTINTLESIQIKSRNLES